MAGSASGIRAGGAFFEFFAKFDQLNKDLNTIQNRLNSFGSAVTAIGVSAGVAGAAITTPFLAASKVFADAGASLVNMSKRTGVSVETLSRLGFAANQTGTDIDSVEISIKHMQKSLIDAAAGEAEMTVRFNQLGLSVQKLLQLSPDKLFEAVAKGMGRLPSAAQRANAAVHIFGRSGTAVLPLIENFNALNKEAKDFGIEVSTKTAQAGLKLEQSMGLLGAVLSTVTKSIGGALAPMLTRVNISMALAAKSVKEFVNENQGLIVTLFKVGLGLTAVATGLTILKVSLVTVSLLTSPIIKSMGALVSIFSRLRLILALVLSPIPLLVAAIAGLAVWFYKSGAAAATLSIFVDIFNSIKNAAVTAFPIVKAQVIAAFGAITTSVTGVFEWLKGQFLAIPGYASTAFSGIKGLVESAFSGIVGLIGGSFGKIAEIFPRLTGSIGFAVNTIVTLLKIVGFYATPLIKIIGTSGAIAFNLFSRAAVAALSYVIASFKVVSFYANLAFVGLAPIVKSVASAITTQFLVIGNIVHSVFNAMLAVAGPIIKGIAFVFQDLTNVVTLVFTGISYTAQFAFKAISTALTTVHSVALSVFGGVKSFVVTAFSTVQGIVAAIPGWFSTAFATAKSFAVSAFAALPGLASTVIGGIKSAFSGLASTLGTVWTGISQSGADALASLGTIFNSLKETALGAFKGISDALKAGDIKLAAQILWVALKLEWAKGTDYLLGVWTNFKNKAAETFSNFKFIMASAFLSTWNDIEAGAATAWILLKAGWTGLINGFKAAWASFASYFQKTANTLGAEVQKAWMQMKHPLTDFSKEFAKIDAETLAKNKAIDTETAKTAEDLKGKTAEAAFGAGTEGAKEIDAIKKRGEAEQAALAEQQKMEDEARQALGNEASEARKKNIRELQTELDKLQTKAAGEAAIAPKPSEKKGPGGGLEGIDEGLAGVTRKTEIKGTFSGQALRGLGTGDTLSEVVKETKRTADEVSKLNGKFDRGVAVFRNAAG